MVVTLVHVYHEYRDCKKKILVHLECYKAWHMCNYHRRALYSNIN